MFKKLQKKKSENCHDQFNASLLNKSIIFLLKKTYWPHTFERYSAFLFTPQETVLNVSLLLKMKYIVL